jgi:hypothetical protein
MASAKIPRGDERVSLGAKTKKKKGKVKEGSFIHRQGKHSETDYADLGQQKSKSKAIRPVVRSGGRNA